MTAEARAAMPRTRADCVDGPRPCPFRSCRHHLRSDFPAQRESCALDIADQGGATWSELAVILHLPGTTLRWVARNAISRLSPEDRALLAEFIDHRRRPRRQLPESGLHFGAPNP